MNYIIDEIKKRAESRSFHFYIDENGSPSISGYGTNKKYPELFIEQRNNSALTKVHVEGMSETHPHIHMALEFLLSINQDFANSQLRFDNNPNITIREFIQSKEINAIDLPKKLYHGTSLKSALLILKEGIRPREVTGQNAKYKSIQTQSSHINKVYLCGINTIGPAKFAARQAALIDNSKPVVLEIDTSDLNTELLRPDEDSKSVTWQDSMNTMGSLSYKGTIKSESVKIEKQLTKSFNAETESSLLL